MMRPAALALLVAGAAAQYGPDFGKCNCSTFCDKSCDVAKTPATNMTLYRMTQFGVVDMTNKNTGDVKGDTSFVISRRTTAYMCRQNPSSFMCSGLAQFQGDVPNCTDLVLKWTIEVDGDWGPYQFCNPVNSSESTGPWACLNEIHFHNAPKPPPPPDFPEMCSANYTGSEGFCYNQHPDDEVSADSLAECCHAAETHWGPRKCANGNCKGGPARNWNYFAANKSCELFGGAWQGDKVAGCTSGEHIYHPPPGPPPPAPCECARMNQTVGRENRSHSGGGGGSNGLPKSCGSNWDMHHSRFLNGTVYDTLKLSGSDTLAKCCAKCGKDKHCDGWQMGNYSDKSSTYTHCDFIQNGTLLNQGKHMIGSVAKNGGGGGGGGNYAHFGEWYSHPEMGECKDGAFVGDGSGCSWRAIGIDKAINASCLYDRIDTNIEKNDEACFSACPAPDGPSHDNPWADPKMTSCYLECYTNTVGKMTAEQLSAPWDKAFVSSDSSQGGCPVVEKICEDGSKRAGCPTAALAQSTAR